MPGFVAKPGGGGRPVPSRHISQLQQQRRLLWLPGALLSSVIDAFRKVFAFLHFRFRFFCPMQPLSPEPTLPKEAQRSDNYFFFFNILFVLFLNFFLRKRKKQPFATNVHYCDHFRIQDRRAVAVRFDDFFWLCFLLSGNNPHPFPVEYKVFSLIKVLTDGGSSAALDLIRVVLLRFLFCLPSLIFFTNANVFTTTNNNY